MYISALIYLNWFAIINSTNRETKREKIMSYCRQVSHKFFAVRIGGCNAIQGYAHQKRLQSWIDNQGEKEVEIINKEELFKRQDKLVTVISLFTNKPVQIRASQVGGVCDPSMESCFSA